MILNKNIINLQKISTFFIILFPASLIAGPLIAEVLMNSLSLFYLYYLYKNKKFILSKFISSRFFIIFIIFYIYLLINSYLSNYSSQIFWKNFFYFRYLVFVYAVLNVLNLNKNLLLLFYKFLCLFLFVVIIDGYIQYFVGTNILGYEKYRIDRISGFFDDRLILGSFLARLLPLLIGLFFFNKNKLSSVQFYISLFLILNTFLLIILTGERTALIFSVLTLIIFLIFFDVKFKFFFTFLFLSLIFFIFTYNKNVFDRIIIQTTDQVDFKFSDKDFFKNFKSYELIYKTAYNGFVEKKIIGNGAGSFKYFCNNPKFEAYKIIKQKPDDNIIFKLAWKHKNLEILQFHKKIGDHLKEGDLLITYKEKNKIKNYYYIGEPGKIINLIGPPPLTVDWGIYLGKIIIAEDKIVEVKENGCTTHPHSFFFQLLSEIGIVGFSYVMGIFLFFLYHTVKNCFLRIFNKKNNLNYLEVFIGAGFFIFLLPILPNGNFFNNWLNMILFFPLPFYLYSLKKKN